MSGAGVVGRGAAAEGRWVVLGATSGIAQAVVRAVAGARGELVLVGRDPGRLQHVADDARVRGARVASAIEADLDDARGQAAVLDRAFASASGPVDVVLLAHGFLADAAACEGDAALAERVLVSNLLGPGLLAQAAALRLAAQGGGTIVGLSSVAGDRSRPSNYQYGAAKAGFTALLEGVRVAFAGRGVRVVTVKPGMVDTAMTAHLPKGRLWAQPETIARAIVRAVERRRDVVYAPGFWRYVMLAIRALPRRLLVRLKL